jgi:uncharacterized membrane protein
MIEIIPNLHPLAVHFPIALAVVALTFQTAARLFVSHRWAPQWAIVGHWSLWLAALTGVLAAFFGWQAFNSIEHDGAGHAAMLTHRAWAVPSAIALLVLAAWDVWRQSAERVNPWGFVALLAVVVAALGATAWHGAELVYRHGLGVIQPPRLESPRDAVLTPAAPESVSVTPAVEAAVAPAAKHAHRHRDGALHAH